MMTMTRVHRCGLGGKPRSRREAFTLIEMLVVLAIISILAIMALPSVKGVLGSMDMKGASNIVTSQLELARQTASTRNVQVDVRIYQDPNVIDPNPNAALTTAGAFRIIAVAITSSSPGVIGDEYISPGLALPGDIVFDQTPAYSTLLDPTQFDALGNTRQVLSTDMPPKDQDPYAPLLLKGKSFIKFTYLANGTMNLSPTGGASATYPGISGNWCLTLRNLHAKAVTVAPVAPANNFISMVLDPTTSRYRVYQP